MHYESYFDVNEANISDSWFFPIPLDLLLFPLNTQSAINYRLSRNLKMSKQNNPNTDNNKMDPTQYFIIFDKSFFEYLFQKKAFKTKFLFNFPMPVIEISGLWKVLQPGLMTIKRSTSVFNFNFRKNMFTTNSRYVYWKNIQKYTEICSIKLFHQKFLSMFTGNIWSSKI